MKRVNVHNCWLAIGVDRSRVTRRCRCRLRLESVTVSPHGKISHRLARYPAVDNDLAFDCLMALARALELHSKLPMVYSTSEAEPILSGITSQAPRPAGEGSPLTVVPHLTTLIRLAVGEFGTAQF